MIKVLTALLLLQVPALAQPQVPRGEIQDRHGNVLASNDADGKRVHPFGAAAAHTLGYVLRAELISYSIAELWS